MGDYTQDDRPMAVTTPLGKDFFLLAGFNGQEGLSQLFSYQLELLVENQVKGPNPVPQDVPFEQLLGKSITVELELPGSTTPRQKKRSFNGICSRITQGETEWVFTHYYMEVVPRHWLLTKRARSRIFQPPHSSVPKILKTVLGGLEGLKVDARGIQGEFHPRDFCVQYRETDFHFASRLMEEEGIYYYFVHANDQHTMVLANSPFNHRTVPEPTKIRFNCVADDAADEVCIQEWATFQTVRSGRYTLRDYCFERPKASLQFSQPILAQVKVGKVKHLLNGINKELEISDYPGEYAQRFDGVHRGGGDNAGDLNKIDGDTERTVKIRMQEEALGSLAIQGMSTCRHLVAGHKFTLTGHFDADGDYVLTTVRHAAHDPSYRSGAGCFRYQITFTCIPYDLPFRPPRTTPKPMIPGTQTAFVVGPKGEEIFTDKYGRVKVQFHWDREGTSDADSSCWVRVGTPWAGQGWGMIHIPRVGQEVIVAFEEGDPDKPIIIGSVFNYDNMPPYTLPDHRTQSGVKSRTTPKGGLKNFNELRFEDKKGHEHIYFHAEKDFYRRVKNNDDLKVYNNQTIEIKNDRTETVKEGNETITIEKGDRTETVKEGDETVTIEKGDRLIAVQMGNDTHQIKQGNRDVQIDMGNDTLTIKMGNQTTKLDLGKSETEAMQSIELKVGQSSIKLDQMGVTIKGMMIQIEGQVQTEVKGLMTTVKADAILTAKGGITMIN
jgi:type VI secretion system secreted protein VgrG